MKTEETVKNYVTQYEVNGKLYAGADIEASSWEEAEEIAARTNFDVKGYKEN